MSQITIRQLPESLEKQLRTLSRKNNTSLNKTIIGLLMASLGLSPGGNRKRNLGDLSETWSENELDEFKKNTEYFNRIDSDIWEHRFQPTLSG